MVVSGARTEAEVEAGKEKGKEETKKSAPKPTVTETEAEMSGDAPPKKSGVQRGMELLAESEMAENLQEVKQLDTQLNHLNEKVGEMEKRIDTHHEKIQGMLNEQKAARLQRKSSFTQRMQETKAADEDWDAKVKALLSRVEQQRNFKPNPNPEIPEQ